MTTDKLAKVLADHAEWLKDPRKGARADLSGADLSGADLRDAYLSGANLVGATGLGTHESHAAAIEAEEWI